MSSQDFDIRNKEVQKWGRGQIAPMKSELRALGVKSYSGELNRRLRDKYGRTDGRVRSVGFAMPRHGIFIHKGVGRGYPIDAVAGKSAGRTLSRRSRNLQNRGFNNRAISRFLSVSDKVGAKQRKPKPWFNPVLDRSIPELSNIVARTNADLLAQKVFII